MCKIRVSVAIANERDEVRALTKLRAFPGYQNDTVTSGRVEAIIEHPSTLTPLQAASWVKDRFGMDPALAPSAQVLA